MNRPRQQKSRHFLPALWLSCTAAAPGCSPLCFSPGLFAEVPTIALCPGQHHIETIRRKGYCFQVK